MHINLSPPIGRKIFSGLDEVLALQLVRLATEMGGSFTAEHGLGRAKVSLADQLRDPMERKLMTQLKLAFDEKRILNPGVISASRK